MRKVAVICGLAGLFVLSAISSSRAQDQPPPEQGQAPSDQGQTPEGQTEPVKVKRTSTVPKFQISAGYANRSYYATDGLGLRVPGSIGTNGWYASFEDNLKKWIGVVGEVVDTGKNQGTILGTTHIYTFLVGPQVYPLGHRKVSPFGQFLYGVGFYDDKVPPCCGSNGNDITSTVRAWAGGGGLDLNLKEHWAVRLLEIDFTSANFFPSTQTYTNRTLRRVSVGVVYRFGKR